YPAHIMSIREAVGAGSGVCNADVHVTTGSREVGERLGHERAHQSLLSRYGSECELEPSMRVRGRQWIIVAHIQLRHPVRALDRELLERTAHGTERACHVEKEAGYVIWKVR